MSNIQDTLKELPRKFHEAYERLAPTFGYETREDTKEFDADSPNGKLMGAVVNEVMTKALEDTREEAVREFAKFLYKKYGKDISINWAHNEERFLKGEDDK